MHVSIAIVSIVIHTNFSLSIDFVCNQAASEIRVLSEHEFKLLSTTTKTDNVEAAKKSFLVKVVYHVK